jgi:translation initiation factor IF-3
VRINEQIRARELRVINSDGTSAGILDLRTALALASGQELDLVEVAPDAKPPVAKILDYAKETFRAQREAKRHKSNDPSHEVKEIQLKVTIEAHDLATKATATCKFLKKGNRVRVVVLLRGRLQQRPEMATAALEKFYSLLDCEYVAEHYTSTNSRISVMLRQVKAGEKPARAKTAVAGESGVHIEAMNVGEGSTHIGTGPSLTVSEGATREQQMRAVETVPAS